MLVRRFSLAIAVLGALSRSGSADGLRDIPGGSPSGLLLAADHGVVPHAWWQSHWFVALACGAVALIVGAVFSWRLRRLLQHRTRQLHQQTDASFQSVIDGMSDLISMRRDGTLIYLNLAARRFYGVGANGEGWDTLGLTHRVHPDDHARVLEVFGDSASDSQLEIRLRDADHSWRNCEISATRVEIGGAITLVITGRDITERKRLSAKLMVSDRMASLGTLAAGIAHEINNPLAFVSGNLELMAETLPAVGAMVSAADHSELGAQIRDARDGADRVRKIVMGLRSFTRSEEERRIPLALQGVLETAVRMTANEVRHRATLIRELGPVPPVLADDGRLTQVFINLLVNATHAIPEGRSDDNRITIRTYTDVQGRAVAEIADTGKGMTAEVQARVFDPFFTTKNVGEGTGLGLSICQGIVTGLGGQISIDSMVGRGTVMRIALPAHAAVVAPVVADAPALAVGTTELPRRQRVLIIDDEPQVAQTIGRLLRRDYDITIALCGREALEIITRDLRFDAIISDVMMPNMTGIELSDELQRIAPDQARRLIFLSGGVFTTHARERMEEIGAVQLEKPVTAKELRACVSQVVHTAEADRRRRRAASSGLRDSQARRIAAGRRLSDSSELAATE